MSRLIKIVLLGFLAFVADTHAVGLLPTPVITDAHVDADASFGSGFGRYIYSYTVSNSAKSSGEIWRFRLDVSFDQSTNGMSFNGFGFTIPQGSSLVDFNTLLFQLLSVNNAVSTSTPFQLQTIVPFGQGVPPGWNGGLGLDGYASFSSGDFTPNILPGASLGGFQLTSFGVPTIRKVQLIPFWMHIVEDHDAVTDADLAAAGQIDQDIIFGTVTLGPSGVGRGSFAHWDELRDDLPQAVKLGWISDNKLANALTSQLATARQTLDGGDRFTAKIQLQTVLDTINQSTAAQRTSEGFALVALNVQSLIDNTPDNQVEPKITLTPKSSVLSVGGQQALSARLIDLANGSRPIVGEQIRFHVDSGPNPGDLGGALTDAQGNASVTYIGRQPGLDKVVASTGGGEVSFDDSGQVLWTGGTDLVVPLFVPPLLITTGGNGLFVSEETQNIGNLPTPATVTRYFISPDQSFDPATTSVVGERQVPALKPGESSTVKQVPLTVPSGLPAGTYFLAACADAGNNVVELDETNNCSFIQLKGRETRVVPMDPPNTPLNCAFAVASPALLWPPDHKVIGIAIAGVTGAASIMIASITQDEPVNGLGDGDTSPDGFGVGTGSLSLRAERSGLGNGRVYAVSFSASDGQGGTCTGRVGVGVPHDQGQGRIPIDDGQIYDSTAP